MKISFARPLLFASALLLAAACADEPKAAPKPAAPVSEPATEAPPAVSPAADSTPPAAPATETVAEKPSKTPAAAHEKPAKPTPPPKSKIQNPKSQIPAGFSDIEVLEPSIGMDIRYATTDNFTKAKIYDCPKCLLRPEAAAAIVEAHKALQQRGLGLKMFDCYRPRPYQQRLWDKVPNPDYVTPPAKGSQHGRGLAVDLTIVDKNGKELDMGTAYDFFGEQAHYDFTKLPAPVLENRRLLRKTLEAVGFAGIRTEWWHFSYKKKEYPLCEEVWGCK